MEKDKLEIDRLEQDGDSHSMASIDNMLSDNAFDLSDDEKIAIIQEYFKNIIVIIIQ